MSGGANGDARVSSEHRVLGPRIDQVSGAWRGVQGSWWPCEILECAFNPFEDAARSAMLAEHFAVTIEYVNRGDEAMLRRAISAIQKVCSFTSSTKPPPPVVVFNTTVSPSVLNAGHAVGRGGWQQTAAYDALTGEARRTPQRDEDWSHNTTHQLSSETSSVKRKRHAIDQRHGGGRSLRRAGCRTAACDLGASSR